MQLNPAARELIFKVAYYGPGLAGKTTNLACLQRSAAPGTASALQTIDTHSERTLHFDMLVPELGEIQGHRVRVEFHTVPGQSYYAATRRQILTGVDAVVFVADSRREALDENIASMNEMLDNLRQLGMPNDLPVVLQYNKQDLPTAVRPEQLDPLMNVRAWPSRGASAAQGQGVLECAHDLLRLVAQSAAAVPLPEVAEAPPRTWLISCHRCQAMLEVPDATVGAVFTCGVCNAALEVVDPDRGLTRAPVAGASPPQQQQPQQPAPTKRPGRAEEPSDYAMKALPDEQAAATSALQRASPGSGAAPTIPVAGGDFPLAGFEVLSFLDENPQGRRLRVRDTTSGRISRALILSQSLIAQPGYAESIEPFVRLAGPLKHPHILPLHELRPASGTVVLLSADVPEHETLGVVLGRRRALAPPHAMGLLRQVVLALEDAARQGVVHGWLRPECILVSPDGSVLVDEFAVPKNHRYLVRELAGASAATEYYLAPEHLGEDARSDLRSDMFLCGALLYRMITGDGLVTGYNAHEALHKLMAAGGKPLRTASNQVSRDLDLFYRQLTALNRGERFESYRELVQVLDRFGGGAKRQTLRLTQPISMPPGGRGPASPAHGSRGPASPAHGSHGGTGAHGRVPTANLRTPAGTPTPAQQRRTGTGEFHNPAKKRGGGLAIFLVIIALLAMAGAVAYVLHQQQLQRQTPPVAPPPAAPAPGQAAVTQPATAPSAPPVAPAPPAPPVAPASPAPAAPAEMTPAERRDLLNRIADLVLAERFQAALGEIERLPAAEDRQTHYQQTIARREARRQEAETRVRTAPDLATVQGALRPALEGVWGMPGDREWAQALLAQAQVRLAAAEPAAPPPIAPPVAPPPAPPVAPVAPVPPVAPVQPDPPLPVPVPEPPTGQADPAADPVLGVLGALARGELDAARSALDALPAEQPESQALRLALSAHPHRAALLDRVAKAKSARLRLTHPATREPGEVTGASAETIEVTANSGSTSALPWGQLGAREVGRLLGEAAAVPGASFTEHASAVGALVVGGDAVLAAVHIRKVKAQLSPEQTGELEALVAVGRRAEATVLLVRAGEALKAGSAKALGDCLAELRKPERAALPAVAAALPRLEAAYKELKDGRPATALSDRIAFDGPGDLAQFPDATGTWQVAAGAAANANAEAARLARRDAGTARSMQAIFTPTAKRGQVTLEFKGLKVVFDLAAGQFTTQVGDKVVPAKPCTIVERVPNLLYVAVGDDGVRATIELNSQVIGNVALGEPAEVFAFAVAGGAVVQLDEVSFTRLDAASPAKQALRRLGWEPQGDAALDDKGAAILLSGTLQAVAGISCQVPANTVGYTVEAKGQGALRVQLTGQGGNQSFDVPLNADAVQRFTVRWAAGTFAILDANGVPLHSAPLARPVAGVAFTARGKVSIALPIRPSRQ